MSNNQDRRGHHLSPAWYLQIRTDNAEPCKKTALIILNSPIADVELVKTLFAHSSFWLCADGGANRLHDVVLQRWPDLDPSDALKSALPSAIHGDLDSLRDAVKQDYQALGVPVSHDGDQYSTDFGKGINKIISVLPDATDILVLGSLGGRIDQGIGLLHEMYREQQIRHPKVRFWLFSEASISTLLPEGVTTVSTKLGDGLLTRNMGILPLYGPASITTKGLEWDVEDWPTQMGGQVSTSNHIVEDSITISTNRPVMLTIERAR